MKIKTSELTGAALDWAVARLERRNPVVVGGRVMRMPRSKFHTPRWLSYSTDWSQGGPIIERDRMLLQPEIGKENAGNAWSAISLTGHLKYGPTPLVAAMRCYVASKLGSEVDVPEELTV